MKHHKKFGLIVGQIFMGIGFALAGAIVVCIVESLYCGLMKMQLDLFGSIMYALIGGYIGMQVGIGYAGLIYLKQNDRQKDFLRFLLQSVTGFIFGLVGIFIVIVPIENRIFYSLINFLAIAMPLIGAIIGFNFRLIPKGNINSNQ